MSNDPFTRNKFRRPDIIFKEFLRKGTEGVFVERGEPSAPLLYRAVVVAIDIEGGKLENPNASGEGVNFEIDGKAISVKPRLGPTNPANSIKARIISNGHDKFATDSNLKVFWPFFPENISIPIKPGEYVYVMFEDSQMQHGLWITKLPGHEGLNYNPGKKSLKTSNNSSVANNFEDSKKVKDSKEQSKEKLEEDSTEAKSGKKLSSLLSSKGK